MNILIICIILYIILSIGCMYYAISHSMHVPDDYGMSEAEQKLYNEINNNRHKN